MAEWSIAAVLKTVEVKASGGSNPSLSAKWYPTEPAVQLGILIRIKRKCDNLIASPFPLCYNIGKQTERKGCKDEQVTYSIVK